MSVPKMTKAARKMLWQMQAEAARHLRAVELHNTTVQWGKALPEPGATLHAASYFHRFTIAGYKALARLETLGMVAYGDYGEVRLTEAG